MTESSNETIRIQNSPKAHVRRKRPCPASSPSVLLLVALPLVASEYTVTWNFGPEDHFFCGMAWDDYNCSQRQNCRSGKSEECLGFSRGETCFEDTPCDSAAGGGRDFSEELYQTTIPTFSPTILTPVPTGPPVTVGPTLIPTDYPIGKPPDLEWPSEDPSDHWYCGIGIDDANERCGIHCPNASECPVGQICYFGTKCDARTHAPSPPPTNRPTKKPTPGPTPSPTITSSPTVGPTTSIPPSAAPTNPQPTRSPTPAPTASPTHGPLTAIQSGFFCATDWNDAITNCKMRCPSGEDPECPVGEFCFAYTGCTEERGYPDGRPPMRAEVESKNSTDTDDEETADDTDECIDFRVVVTADEWPAETSWSVIEVLDGGNTNETAYLAEGKNDKLVTGEAVEYNECLPKKCMQFTITDTGGDGLCCDHGEGSYEVYYDGKKVKGGNVFYDSEVTVFGRCGETPAPTVADVVETEAPNPAPSETAGNGNSNVGGKGDVSNNGGNSNNNIVSGGDGGSSYRCVQQSLVDEGYVIGAALCPRFIDCYNEFIDMGDDWFCEDGEVCTDAPACGSSGGEKEAQTVVQDKLEEQPDQEAIGDEELPPEANEENVSFDGTDSPVSETVGRPPTASEPSKPVPVGRPLRPNPSTSTLTVPDPTPAPIESTQAPIASTAAPVASTLAPIAGTPEPTIPATSLEPSLTPTTSSPTQGPCDGEPCNRNDYCRSQHGFCGPDEGYCNDKSIWSKQCKSKPTPAPSYGATTPSPTDQPVTPSPALAEIFVNNGKPSFAKPSGGGKPGGGKGPNKKPQPEPTPMPSSEAPTGSGQQTDSPTESDTTPSPTGEDTTSSPTPSPAFAESKGSQGLSLGTVNFVSLPSDSDVPIQFITNAPAPNPPSESSDEMQENSTELETNSKDSTVETTSATLDVDESVNELECTGEPCDQDSWCRSMFGSCGPGFIYCNAKAIWTSSCRLTHPDATYSEQPPSEPVASPQVTAAVDSDAETNDAAVPVPAPSLTSGLPDLPKPTLPTITDATEFKNQAAFAASFSTSRNEQDDDAPVDDSHDDDSNQGNEAAVKPKEKEKNDPSESYSYPTMYDTPEYAKQWGEWAKQVQSSAPSKSYNSHAVYFAGILTAVLLLCA